MINNKGELLFPESDFGKRSESRNRLLTDLLSRTKYMEKAGTGIKRVRDACELNENKCTFAFSDAFWITIESFKEVTNVVGKGVGKDDGKGVGKELNELQNGIIIQIKENNNITIPQLAEILKTTTRTIERNIEKLKQMQIITRIGGRKEGFWEIIDLNV